jgi:hypothetical protein
VAGARLNRRWLLTSYFCELLLSGSRCAGGRMSALGPKAAPRSSDRLLPVEPCERTSLAPTGMSEMGQRVTSQDDGHERDRHRRSDSMSRA